MRTKIKSIVCLAAALSFFVLNPAAKAGGSERIQVTVLTASNQGSDFNLDNDAYRDQLIKLFSYSSYNQQNQLVAELEKGEHKIVELIENYELVLTLQQEQKDRILIQAIIRKDGVQYVNTVLSVLKEGVVFLGGPVTQKGALILVLQRL